MPRFYFDHLDGDDLVKDDDGLELETVEQAREEAAAGLAGVVKDALPHAIGREMAIEISDENRRPSFRLRVWSRLEPLG